MGYIVKAHAGRELLPAVDAVCQGRQFVSKGLPSRNWISATPDGLSAGLNTHGIASSTDRHARVDRCPKIELRFDEKRSLYQLQPFFHADEAQSSTLLCSFAVKADATVSNREMNLIRRSPQSHFDVLCPTVFYRIVEGLLQHSEEAKRSVRRQGAWYRFCGVSRPS
jgi:hypothetical protein